MLSSFLSRKARVLVLDDDPSMQRLISALLRRKGYRVDVVSGATQALEKIGTVKYAVMLLDLMTPTEGGMTVIKHLRERDPGMLRRVIVVTASPDSILKFVDADVAAIVHKPFEHAALLAAVDRVVEGA